MTDTLPPNKTCTSQDCPERTGGECTSNLSEQSELYKKAIQYEEGALLPKNEICPKSRRTNGDHSFLFDGDDPYIVCSYCGQTRDALSGSIIKPAHVGLPKNDDTELLELIDDAFDAYYGDTLWDDDQKQAKYHDFTRGELLTIIKARDTKMLEQARREARIQQIYDIITPIYRDDELIDYVQNLGGYDLIGILDKLKGESK